MKYEKTASVIREQERGVALLFVILLTSVLLLVAIGIANVSYKEATFSVEAKDSDRAFFAADSGIECALMLDTNGFFGGTPVGSPSCDGYAPPIVDSGGGNYVFAIPLGSQCAEISVNKDYPYDDGDGTGAHSYTQISSLGYNVAADPTALPTSCITGTPGPKVITRALGTRYINPTSGGGSGTTSGGSTGGGSSSGGSAS